MGKEVRSRARAGTPTSAGAGRRATVPAEGIREGFVGFIAHELRTPLTALRGYLQLLQRTATAGSPRLVELALQQADRLQRLVDDLFDVTRLEHGRFTIVREPVALGELLEQTIEIAQGLTDSHRIVYAPEEVNVVARVDPARVQQVMLNLLMNAIVHAPESPDITVRLRKHEGRAEIEVEDHGPGIALDEQASLFAPFEQGQTPGDRTGLGLGLYISREIVAAHGGTIGVDSAPGEGTTFTVRIPLGSHGEASSAAADAGGGGGAGPGWGEQRRPRKST